MHYYQIQKQEHKLRKGVEKPIDLYGKLAPPLHELLLKIGHDSEESLSLLFIFENKNGTKFNYPKNFIRSGQPIKFDDKKFTFEGPIKSMTVVSEIDIAVIVN